MRVEPRSADDLAKMLRCEVGTIHKLRAFTPHSFRDKLAKVGLVALANLDANEVEFLLDNIKSIKIKPKQKGIKNENNKRAFK